MTNSQIERWGEFVLAEDLEGIDQVIENQAPRADFRFGEGFGPFDHPDARIISNEAAARSDPMVPRIGNVPSGTVFHNAVVLEDDKGFVEGIVTYIRPDLRTVAIQRIDGTVEYHDATPGDATIYLSRSIRYGRPLYIAPLSEDKDKTPAVVYLVRTEKITVRGHEGIMRIYETKEGSSTYPYRIPSVALNWFEGDEHWALQTHFLTPGEALQLAESIQD